MHGGEAGVITLMNAHDIISLKMKGFSNREVARQTGFDRKTVARHWNEYLDRVSRLDSCEDIRDATEDIIAKPTYDASGRSPIKYNDQIDRALDAILADEERKRQSLGKSNKQMKTCRQIHAQIRELGFDIGLTTITAKISEKRKVIREAFIAQSYEYGDRLEYDFGDVRLEIAGEVSTYYLAVFGSPAASFRWAYLYENQKKEVFLDSHVRFFEMMGGSWRETVYDNMKNVVTRFIGKSEKDLNQDLVSMSLYYGYAINVTNCFAAHEKGYVESSVKVLRREIFGSRWQFSSLDEARNYLERRLISLSENSNIASERVHLQPYRPPLEIAKISTNTVDKYSFIHLETNRYSVPDYLVGHRVITKMYQSEVVVYAGLEKVCTHRRLEGSGQLSVDIFHYLDTLARKPGALPRSTALRQCSALYDIYHESFTERPRDFIECLRQNEQRPLVQIVDALRARAFDTTTFTSQTPKGIELNVLQNSRSQLSAISDAFLKRGEKVGC